MNDCLGLLCSGATAKQFHYCKRYKAKPYPFAPYTPEVGDGAGCAIGGHSWHSATDASGEGLLLVHAGEGERGLFRSRVAITSGFTTNCPSRR